MDPDETLTWLPPAWKKVFSQAKQAEFNPFGVGGAERCLLEAEAEAAGCFHGNLTASASPSFSSQHPLPDWFSLLSSLMAKQGDNPEKKDYELCRFLQLPVHMQRTILALVSHHALEIPLPLLQTFTREMQDCKVTDHWSLFHLHTLQNYIATHLPPVGGQRSKFNPLGEGYISKQSRNLFEDVCKSINSNREQHDLPPSLFPEYNGVKSFVECFQDGKVPRRPDEQSDQDFMIQQDAEMTAPNFQPSKRKSDLLKETVSLEGEQSRVEQPVAVRTDSGGGEVLVQPPPSPNLQELEGINEMDVLLEGMDTEDAMNKEEQAKKTEKITLVREEGENSRSKDDDANGPAANIGDKKSFVDELSDELKSQLLQMKTSWHGESSLGPSELHGCSEAIQLMGTCAPLQLSEVCDYIDITSATISVLPAVCQCIIPSATQFSFKSSVILAERLFLGKMSALTHTASTVLATSLTDFTKTFPKPAIEGILTPCLICQESSSSFQVDLVSKVAKEALSADLRSYLLRNVLIHPNFVWSEPFSGFVQGLLDMKVELDSSLLGLLTSSMAESASSHAQCKKFAKLLLATINKSCKQLAQDHVTSLQRSVEINQTFLKKACQNALKKVKL